VDYGSIDPVGLVQTTYLDTDMLQTYLAALEDGVTYVTRENIRTEKERARQAGVQFKIPILSNLGVEARLAQRDSESIDSVIERRHTASSLFVKLRTSLVYDNDAVRMITTEAEATLAEPGDLVEITGELTVDPLVSVLDALADTAELVEQLSEVKVLAQLIDAQFNQQVPDFTDKLSEAPAPPSQRPAGPAGRRGQGQAGRRDHLPARPRFSLSESLLQGARVLDRVRTKVGEGPVTDYVMRVPSSDLRVVLPLGRQYLESARAQQMDGGYFTVLGTVTRNVADDSPINLIRRSVFGVLPRTWVEQAYEYMRNSRYNLTLPDLIIGAPALQLLPLAIFA
jgi:hypothetical protein